MQIIAMLTMLIDHIGYIFFSDSITWRIIGRIAFPIYAYFIVVGFHHTSNRQRYLWRLIILAAISQIPYILSLQTMQINVIGTLAVCLAVLLIMDHYEQWLVSVITIITGLLLLYFLPFDYTFYALLLILIFRYLDQKYWVLAHFSLNIAMFVVDTGWWLQSCSIIPTLWLAYRNTFFSEFRINVVPPRWLWRSFYPTHLAVLALLVYFIKR
ncbi:MAG: TraX family protein [Candidatus Cohnella colombiensis]|uniref:TraX family protein n=1 Tax=Candidatus Cohnella colombiensis TaxID=3121368 RepID=A0AA95F4J0_9BACL|nr:MAG: TraX family protein [Cohnella sp.]